MCGIPHKCVEFYIFVSLGHEKCGIPFKSVEFHSEDPPPKLVEHNILSQSTSRRSPRQGSVWNSIQMCGNKCGIKCGNKCGIPHKMCGIIVWNGVARKCVEFMIV